MASSTLESPLIFLKNVLLDTIEPVLSIKAWKHAEFD